MGCSSSKSDMPAEPTTLSQANASERAKNERILCDDVTDPLDTALECTPCDPKLITVPRPPPVAPRPCCTYKIDPNAAPCLSLPTGWLCRTAIDGTTKAGDLFYHNVEGKSQWERPEGPAKENAEATCTCGCLREAHIVCGDCEPQLGTDPLLCKCGFAKEEHKPCGHYRVNTRATNFGECKCGFSKEEHEARAFGAGVKKELHKKTSAELRGEMVQKTFADCAKYCVDLESSNFGQCKCGRPKADHSPEALAKNAIAGQTAGTTRRDADAVRTTFVQKQKVECLRYEPNLISGEFGVCICGAKRADHSAVALAADTGAKLAKQKEDAAVRAGFIGRRSVADCPRFVVTMDPAAPFGTCICGRPRAEHSDAALNADHAPRTMAKKTSFEIREEMAAKQQVIGTAVESQGAKTGVAFGIGNTVRTAAEEEARVKAAINARAGGADKAAALNEFNEMMKDAAAPAAASA